MSPITGLLPGRPAESLRPRLRRDRHDTAGRTSQIHRNPRTTAQELRPAGADPPRRRPEASAAQHGRDRGRRDADPQPLQLTLDAHVAPLGVLARQPPDQTEYLGGKRRTTEP